MWKQLRSQQSRSYKMAAFGVGEFGPAAIVTIVCHGDVNNLHSLFIWSSFVNFKGKVVDITLIVADNYKFSLLVTKCEPV